MCKYLSVCGNLLHYTTYRNAISLGRTKRPDGIEADSWRSVRSNQTPRQNRVITSCVAILVDVHLIAIYEVIWIFIDDICNTQRDVFVEHNVQLNGN